MKSYFFLPKKREMFGRSISAFIKERPSNGVDVLADVLDGFDIKGEIARCQSSKFLYFINNLGQLAKDTLLTDFKYYEHEYNGKTYNIIFSEKVKNADLSRIVFHFDDDREDLDNINIEKDLKNKWYDVNCVFWKYFSNNKPYFSVQFFDEYEANRAMKITKILGINVTAEADKLSSQTTPLTKNKPNNYNRNKPRSEFGDIIIRPPQLKKCIILQIGFCFTIQNAKDKINDLMKVSLDDMIDIAKRCQFKENN